MSILCLEIAGLTAGRAIVLAVFAETDTILGQTITAIPFALAFSLWKIAYRAYKILRHEVEIIAKSQPSAITVSNRVQLTLFPADPSRRAVDGLLPVTSPR